MTAMSGSVVLNVPSLSCTEFFSHIFGCCGNFFYFGLFFFFENFSLFRNEGGRCTDRLSAATNLVSSRQTD